MTNEPEKETVQQISSSLSNQTFDRNQWNTSHPACWTKNILTQLLYQAIMCTQRTPKGPK